MKFLEYTPFDSINLFLEQLNLGDCTIRGNLEAFSCKHTVTDRRLSISLEHELYIAAGGLLLFLLFGQGTSPVILYVKLVKILDYLGKSSDSDPSSPVEHLSSRSSQRTLIYLVLTLGHMYPDYDFSAVRAHLFFQEEEKISGRCNGQPQMRAVLFWTGGTQAIDEVIKIRECDIYSYNPDSDADPVLEEGAIWSFNYYFYNRKLKRVVSFRCYCTSKLSGDDFLTGVGSDGEEEDDLIDMDI